MRLSCMIYVLLNILISISGRNRNICERQPTINGLCVTSTLGIYYDAETQHCKYVGCSPDKKLFNTLEDCERICNSRKQIDMRIRHSGSKQV